MINIDKFRSIIFLISNKNGRGTLTPQQFNLATEMGLYAWTNSQVSNVKQYSPDDPKPQTSVDVDILSQARLRHLKENRTIRVINGFAALPDGVAVDVNTDIMPAMWVPSRLMHKYSSNGNLVEKEIDIVKDMEWSLRVNSNILTPTKKHAVANIQSTSMRIEPKESVSLVTLTYIRNPTKPEWKFTTVNNRPVYDAQNSVDLDAPDSALNEIAMITLEFIGIKIRDIELIQSTTGMESKGV